MIRLIPILCGFILLTALAFASNEVTENLAKVETVKFVDLNQYIGRWFEVAAIPQFFQRKCMSNTVAEYSLTEDQFIKVSNTCIDSQGKTLVALGRAKVVDLETKAKLKVTFLKIFDWIYTFSGNYWILDLGENYSYAVIGDPTRKYSWILSRTPSLPMYQLIAAEQKLKSQGYDTCLLLTSIQSGGFTERKPLCEVVQ